MPDDRPLAAPPTVVEAKLSTTLEQSEMLQLLLARARAAQHDVDTAFNMILRGHGHTTGTLVGVKADHVVVRMQAKATE